MIAAGRSPRWVDYETPIDQAMRLVEPSIAFSEKYRASSGAWKRGFVERSRLGLDPIATGIMEGLMGENAMVETINARFGHRLCEVDLKRRERGDGGTDIWICGWNLQLKTRCSRRRSSLIRRVDDRGNDVPLKADAHFFLEFLPDRNPDGSENLRVRLLGGLPNELIESAGYPVVPGRGKGAEHKNIEIPDEDIFSPRWFFEQIRLRLEGGAWR